MEEFVYNYNSMETVKKYLFLFFFIVSFFLIPTFSCSPIEEKEDIDDEEIVENYDVEELPILSDEDGWDTPANEGVRNALLNAKQLVEIKYTPIAAFNKVGGQFQAGETVQGIVYSSTRAEDLEVPNNVSLWTYMSALKNPNSYPYTVDITQPPYSIRGSAGPFYGQVCTSFVQYALGIKYNFQIFQMTKWKGFDKVIPQDVDKLRLGDVLTSLRGHTMMITGIRREGDHVVEVAIAEGITPCARERIYPVQYVLEAFEKEQFVMYRYRYINDTNHIQSPFVCVGEEVPMVNVEMPVEEVIPRRGDKANWRKNERVILDVINRGDYTSYKLYKDDILLETFPIPENNILDFGIMPYGNYHLCLSNGEEDSKYAYWIVADYYISATALGDRKVKVFFTSRNALPIWVTWRRPANLDANNNNMPLWTTVITDSDRKRGYVITQLNEHTAKNCGLGQWDFKVAYETMYGIISSDSETVYVN